MRIAYNPTTALTSTPLNNDITFDLVGHNIYAFGVKFAGTDTTYDVFKKDTSNSTGGRIGLVPVPDYNNNSLTRFLREDGTWANIQVPASITYTFEGGVNSFKVTPSNGTTLTILITPNVTLNDILCSNYTIATEIKNIATIDTLNSALGKLEYKADLGVTAYSLISAANNGESIDNLAEILKVLEGIKDTETIQAIVGKYLPLSGGTIGEGNSNSFPLQIASTNSYTGISFKTNAGTAWLRYLGNAEWNVTDLGWAHSYNLIHTGNIGSQSVNNALHLNGIPASNYATLGSSLSHYGILDAVPSYSVVGANYSGGNWLGYTYATEEHGGYVAGGVISAGTSNAGFQLNGSPNTDELYFRGRISGKWGGWKQIAFTHSTVEAANKLSTARTIWGQSFDGTGNVSGNLTLGDAAIYGGAGRNVLALDASSLSLGYGYRELAVDLYGNNIKFKRGASSINSMIINSSGNVTIGNSNLAGTSAKLYVDGSVRTHSISILGSSNSLFLNRGEEGIYVHSRGIGLHDSNNQWVANCISFDSNGNTTIHNNVGIGTTAPAYKLDVNGIIHASEFRSLVSDDHYKMLEMGVINGRRLRVHTAAGTSGVSGRMAALSLYEGDSCYGSIGVTTTGPVWIDSSNTRHELLHSGSNLTIEKTLIVSKDWIDTGIIFDSATFPTGTGSYMVQLSRDDAYYYTGYLSVIISSNVTRANTDEIILHGGGFDMTSQYYLRTVQDIDNKVIKLLIARSSTYSTSKKYTFKFKKLI